MDPLRWEALRLADENALGEAFGLLMRAIETAERPEDAHRAFEAIARVARRGTSPAVLPFLEDRTAVADERPRALLALADVLRSWDRPRESEEAARMLISEAPAGDLAIKAWAVLHALSLDAGDGPDASEALAAVTARWPEHETALAMHQEHGLVIGASSAEAARTQGAVAARTLGAPAKSQTADEEPTAQTHLGLARPNPAAGRAVLPLVLSQDAEVRVSVSDVLGRTVATLADGPLGSGRHTLALDGETLPPGVYIVRAQIQTGSIVEAFVQRVTVTR
ncbi:MAG: T9SS type A sorting domain-containing protein [Bacteroidota bacterium]